MTRHKDPVWGYAKRINPNQFICSFCNNAFFGTAKRLKLHLAQAGGRGAHIRSCPNVSPDVRDKCLHWLQDGNTSSSSCQDHRNDPNEAEKSAKEATPRTDEDGGAMRLRMSVCRFFRSSGLPLEVVEDAAFVDMFFMIAHFGSSGVPAPRELHEIEGFIDDDNEEEWD